MIESRASMANHRSKFSALSSEEMMKSIIRSTLSSFLAIMCGMEFSDTAGLLQSFISMKYSRSSVLPYHFIV